MEYLFIVRKIYVRRISEKDEFTASLWKRVLLHMQLGKSQHLPDCFLQCIVNPQYIYVIVCLIGRRPLNRVATTANPTDFSFISKGITAADLQSMGTITTKDLKLLENVLETEVPKLRRMVGPSMGAMKGPAIKVRE